jgi:hypothetical protein
MLGIYIYIYIEYYKFLKKIFLFIFFLSVLDNWLLFSFSILFILIHIGFMIRCFNSYKSIKKLQMENRLFSGLERRKK